MIFILFFTYFFIIYLIIYILGERRGVGAPIGAHFFLYIKKAKRPPKQPFQREKGKRCFISALQFLVHYRLGNRGKSF